MRKVIFETEDATTLAELEQPLRTLVRALDASGGLIFRFRDDDGALEGVAGSLAPAIPEYSKELFAEDPVHPALASLYPYPSIARALFLPTLDRERFFRGAAYHDFYRPLDVEHMLGAWVNDRRYGQPGMIGLFFSRPRSLDDFGATEMRILTRALPGFVAAARRSVRRARLDTERAALEAIVALELPGPRLALDTRGQVLWMSREATQLLGCRPAPEELIEKVLAFLRSARSREETQLRLGSAEIRIHLTRTFADGDPIVVVEIDRGGDPARIAEVARQYRLTRAESEVLALIAVGLSNALIAQHQHVSLETVRTHVHRVLGKLGVASRTEAAVRVLARR